MKYLPVAPYSTQPSRACPLQRGQRHGQVPTPWGGDHIHILALADRLPRIAVAANHRRFLNGFLFHLIDTFVAAIPAQIANHGDLRKTAGQGNLQQRDAPSHTSTFTAGKIAKRWGSKARLRRHCEISSMSDEVASVPEKRISVFSPADFRVMWDGRFSAFHAPRRVMVVTTGT